MVLKNIIKSVAVLLCMCFFTVQVQGQNSLSDSTYNATMNEAMKNVNASNIPSAIFYLKKAVEMRPAMPAPYYELSRMYDKMVDGAQTVYYAKKAYSLAPQNIWYEEYLLSSAVKYQKYDAAINIMEVRYKRNEDNFSDLMDLYFMTSSWDKTISVLNDYEKKHGVSQKTMQYRLRVYVAQKDYKNAFKAVNTLLKKEPDNTAYAREKLLIMHGLDKVEEGWKYFSQYYALHPNDGGAAYTMMSYYNEHQSFDALLDCLSIVVADTTIAVNIRIQILESAAPLVAKDTVYIAPFEKALTIFTLNANDDYPTAYAYAGEYYFAKGDEKKSKEFLRKALHSGNTDVQKIQKLLYLESREVDFKSIYTDARLAIEAGVNDPDVYMQYGFAAYQIGDVKGGIDALERAKSMAKDASITAYTQLCSMLGSMYNDDKQYDKSDENFEIALRLTPNDATALNNYAYYLSLRKKDLPKAKKMSEQSLVLEPENDSFLDTYAYILYLEKDYDKALQYIEKVMSITKEPSLSVLEHYRDILLATGKKEKAQAIDKLCQEFNNKTDK